MNLYKLFLIAEKCGNTVFDRQQQDADDRCFS